MLTLAARLYKGSAHAGVNNTASIFKAAAFLKIAPRFVGFTTSSNMAILVAQVHISATDGSGFLRMHASMPFVSLYPVSFVNTSNSAIYTGAFSISLSISDTSAFSFSM